MSAPFFFYGSLLGGGTTSAARSALRLLDDRGAASVAGRLIAISDPRGWYPGLTGGDGAVCGRLFAVRDEAAIALLDAYEGFDPARPDAGDYRREDIVAIRADGTRSAAQTYRWIAPAPAGSETIDDGDFLAWLARTGHRPLGD